MKIDKQLFEDLIYGHVHDAWLLIEDEVTAPTDWGSEYTAVLQSTQTGRYYAFSYAVEGKGGYNSLEDEPRRLELWEVEPMIVTKTVYVQVTGEEK